MKRHSCSPWSNRWLKLTFASLGALLTACSFALNFSAAEPDTSALSHAFSHRVIPLGFLFLLFFALYTFVVFYIFVPEKCADQSLRGTWIVSLILGSGYAVGDYFWNGYPFSSSLGQIGKLGFATIGFTVFFWFVPYT